MKKCDICGDIISKDDIWELKTYYKSDDLSYDSTHKQQIEYYCCIDHLFYAFGIEGVSSEEQLKSFIRKKIKEDSKFRKWLWSLPIFEKDKDKNREMKINEI